MRYRVVRFGLLAVLVAMSAAGCGARRSVIATDASTESATGLVTVPLRKGDLVELQLADGSRLTGRVCDFRPDALVLSVATHPERQTSLFGSRELRQVPLADIRGGVRLGGGQPPNLLAFVGLSLVVLGSAALLGGAL